MVRINKTKINKLDIGKDKPAVQTVNTKNTKQPDPKPQEKPKQTAPKAQDDEDKKESKQPEVKTQDPKVQEEPKQPEPKAQDPKQPEPKAQEPKQPEPEVKSSEQIEAEKLEEEVKKLQRDVYMRGGYVKQQAKKRLRYLGRGW